MKISPILNSYCSDTNKAKQKTPFKRIITTPADIQKVVKSPLSDSQKKLFLDAYEKAKDYLEELDADINLEYRPKDKKKYFFECQYLFPEALRLNVTAQNNTLDKATLTVDVLDDVRKGVDVDTLADKLKKEAKENVDYIKRSFTYRPTGDDEFFRDNTGTWDLTDAYIP